MRRENTARTRGRIAAAGMTIALLLLLLLFYMGFESRRTLQKALQTIDGAPLSFSEKSGFFEEPFTLFLTADSRIPQKDSTIEIHYTFNGDAPTKDSPLYTDGIDLGEVLVRLRAEEAAREERRQEIIRKTEEKKEAERISAEQAAEITQTQGTAAEKTQKQETEAEKTQKQETAAEKAQTRETAAEKTQTRETEAEKTQTQETAAALSADSAAGEDSAAEKPARPTLEDGRAQWEQDRWSLSSDAGVYPERAGDGIYVIPIRACLFQGDDRSSIVTRTYVVGEGVRERYDVYVASVVTDSYNLYDYDNGIMVPGSHYLSDVADGVRPDRAGNFYQTGDEWIKDGHVTLFSPEGEVLLEEDSGLAIAGYSSRIMPTRTFRAEASKDRGTSGDYFRLDIFNDQAAPTSGEAGTADPSQSGLFAARDTSFDLFKKIKFRSHGVPGYHIRSVRNQYAKILTDECGFPGLTQNRLGVMFLNGEFYTVCDITPSTTKDYLCRLFGLNVPDGIEKYSGSDVDVYTKAKILKLFTADLTLPENQKRLEDAVDMDNYLFYFALEVLFNNADWPYNNVTVWRYLGESDPANPWSDGRIRYLIEDMDQILTNGLHGDPARWSDEVVDYMMKDKGSTFSHVMQCTRYRDTFLTYVDDLLGTAFEPEHACAVLDALYAELKEEYILDYGEPFWAEMEQTAEATKKNVREKEALYREDITKYMGLTARCPVRIEAAEGVTVTWNNMAVAPGKTWSGEYYCGTSFEITAKPEEGYTFAGWEINGEKTGAGDNTDAVLTLTVSDTLRGSSRRGDAASENSDEAEVIIRALAEP